MGPAARRMRPDSPLQDLAKTQRHGQDPVGDGLGQSRCSRPHLCILHCFCVKYRKGCGKLSLRCRRGFADGTAD
nr:MAG TPA: hypothetical protein [Caudoviricetes sp.]